MSCNKHDSASMIEELEYETIMMRARMERLEKENDELRKQNDFLKRRLSLRERYDND